jgi:hypothetical protein
MPDIGVTIHPVDDDSCYAVAVNYSATEKSCDLLLGEGWTIAEVLYGNTEALQNGEMTVLKLEQKH